MSESKVDLSSLACGIPSKLPPHPGTDASVPHAPNRPLILSPADTRLALKNVLRYFPKEQHEVIAPEIADELATLGHIYCYRLRPTQYKMRAYSLADYPAKCRQAASIQLMIMNNLNPAVAQFPDELITYGGNGSVFSNWAQYAVAMRYLSIMTDTQTLVCYSGHCLGLFPSHADAPRMVITNGMVIPNYSSRAMYDKMYAQCVSQYGQMTAGSYCYIGPQGIVHGTTLTVMNAARKYLGLNSASGVIYVSSGLGGMSGAQPKAAKIAGCVGVIAEVDGDAVQKRFEQGWVDEVIADPAQCIARMKEAQAAGEGLSIAFHGNIVTLWEALVEEPDDFVQLGSDQTSLHNPYLGGYYPVQLSLVEARAMMRDDPVHFKRLVKMSLRRHVGAINKLAKRGLHFWDYGNAFLVESFRAGAEIMVGDPTIPVEDGGAFRYPSYVQDIMGDVFSLGFGPFRWVCTSGLPGDLATTDAIAAEVFERLMQHASPKSREQYDDNLKWIREAGANRMVVGSQARILYSNCEGRVELALAFNAAVKSGRLTAPVVLSRDHHDVSGTDSPYRETSNITDGSQFCADMAIQNVIGDAARGATWVAIHNGGGCGWGEVINGGFGMLLDGSSDCARRADNMLHWDVCNGVTRRSWAGNQNAIETAQSEMKRNSELLVTMPVAADDALLDGLRGTTADTGGAETGEEDGGFDLLLTNCRVATMSESQCTDTNPFGVIEEASIGIRQGLIDYVGTSANLSPERAAGAKRTQDMGGALVTPGLIDCHTHVVYGGDRCGEWAMKLNGATYEEVAKAGGGINNTVSDTRACSVDDLVKSAMPRVSALLSEGVTTLEIKSGYGLELESERRMLQAARSIGERLSVDVVTTFLGAHCVPREYAGRSGEYIEEVLKMTAVLKAEGLVDAVDVFMETIGFSAEETSRVFDQAKSLELPIRLHGDQLHDNEGGSLVAKYKALSCDHCEYTSEASAKAMAEANSVAVLLPAANYFINEAKLPPVELFRREGVRMALATNCNPGSSPCVSLLLVLNMACSRFRMTPQEALLGVTRHAAQALGLAHDRGTIQVGKRADLAVWTCSDPVELAYYMGLNPLKSTFVAGVER